MVSLGSAWHLGQAHPTSQGLRTTGLPWTSSLTSRIQSLHLPIYPCTMPSGKVNRDISKGSYLAFKDTVWAFGELMKPGDIVEANIVGGLNPATGSPVANATWNSLNRLGLALCWSNESKHQRKCPTHRKIHQLLRWCKDKSWIFGGDHSFRSHVSVYLMSRDTGSSFFHIIS